MSRVKIPEFYIRNHSGKKIDLSGAITGKGYCIDVDRTPLDTLEYLDTVESPAIRIYMGQDDMTGFMFIAPTGEGVCVSEIEVIQANFFKDLIAQKVGIPSAKKEKISLSLPQKNTIVPDLIQELVEAWLLSQQSIGDVNYNMPLQTIFKQLYESGADFTEFFSDFTEMFFNTDPAGHDFLLLILKSALEAVKSAINDIRLFDDPIIFSILLRYSTYSSGRYNLYMKKCLTVLNESEIDIWQKHDRFGSFLHFSIANESSGVQNLLDMLIDLKIPIAHDCQDAQGRTALMCAILTRQTNIASKLIEIIRSIHNVTERRKLLDIKDSHGRSALMLATGLGMKKIVSMLIINGANPSLEDNEKNDWEYYARLPKEIIDSLFRSIAMHPDRSVIAPRNYFRGVSTSGAPLSGAPLMIVTGSAETLLVKSCARENLKLIRDSIPQLEKMRLSTPNKLQKQVITHYIDEINAFLRSTHRQSRDATTDAELITHSISEQAMHDQQAMQTFIDRYKQQQSIRVACVQGDFDQIKIFLPVILSTMPLEVDYLGRTLFFYLAMRESLSKPYRESTSTFEGVLAKRKEIAKLLIQNGVSPSYQQKHIGGRTVFEVLSKNIGHELPLTDDGYLHGLDMMGKREG